MGDASDEASPGGRVGSDAQQFGQRAPSAAGQRDAVPPAYGVKIYLGETLKRADVCGAVVAREGRGAAEASSVAEQGVATEQGSRGFEQEADASARVSGRVDDMDAAVVRQDVAVGDGDVQLRGRQECERRTPAADSGVVEVEVVPGGRMGVGVVTYDFGACRANELRRSADVIWMPVSYQNTIEFLGSPPDGADVLQHASRVPREAGVHERQRVADDKIRARPPDAWHQVYSGKDFQVVCSWII